MLGSRVGHAETITGPAAAQLAPSDIRAMTHALLFILLFDYAVGASECQIIVDGRNVSKV